MNLMITEVQITCIVLMSLMTLILAFILPCFTMEGRVLNNARKLLVAGTSLIVLHFVVQYFLFKQLGDVPHIRTAINLLFGFPITFCINLSLIYLQRQGSIRVWEWLLIPALHLSSLAILVPTMIIARSSEPVYKAMPFVAALYGIVLLWSFSTQIIGYLRIVKILKTEENLPFILLNRWTKWSMILCGAVSLGFPLMTFNTNLLMRSIYGILSISTGFFYTFSFLGYAFNCSMKTQIPIHPNIEKCEEEKERKARLEQVKLERMEHIVDQFIESGFYLKSGITIKDVAVQMGVSCNMLKMWLRTTQFGKFSNWIVALRIHKAKEMLLLHPDYNSEEIAEKCGFCDRQYFQSQFRKQEGITPSKWAKENQLSDLVPLVMK